MRILIVGSNTSLGDALQDFLHLQSRHAVEVLSLEDCRWKSERQAKKALRRANCELVIDVRIVAAADGDEIIHDLDIDRTLWLAKASHRNNVGYLYLSSSRVFSGTVERLYSEDDYPDDEGVLGELLLRSETAVRDHCERHLILRLGPVFSHRYSNALTRMLGHLVEGGSLCLGNSLRGSPVVAEDAARVVSALADQLSTEADVWGIYHYCSSEVTNCYEFAESLLASAAQYAKFQPNAVEIEKSVEPTTMLNRALDCAKIRNTFAIKQVAWRSFVAGSVENYFLSTQQ